MYRHEIHVLLRVRIDVTSDAPLPRSGLLRAVAERLGAWRREELRWEKESGLRRLSAALTCSVPLGEGKETVLRSDDDAVNLTIDQGPLLVAQSSDEEPGYADSLEQLRCNDCGSHDVEDARWVDAATLEPTESASSIGDEVYCRRCQEQSPAEYGSLLDWRRTHPSS